jgi:hypothetical protein
VIGDLERRLGEVLAARLPAAVADEITVAVVGATRIEDDWHGRRPETVPGAGTPRRVVRLRCALRFQVGGPDRAARLSGLDTLLYALDDPALRTALAPEPATDPGFQLHTMVVDALTTPSAPDDENPVAITATATGLFWPVGTPGVDAGEITELQVRAGRVPLTVRMPATPFTAGGAAAAIDVVVVPVGGLTIRADGTTTRPLDRIAVRLTAAGNRPGAGTIGGGSPGTTAGVRLFDLVDGIASVTYTPPATAARDVLDVAMARDGTLGTALARIPLPTDA